MNTNHFNRGPRGMHRGAAALILLIFALLAAPAEETASAGQTAPAVETNPAGDAAAGAEVESLRNWGVVPLPLIAYTPDTGGMFGVAAIFFYGPDVGVPEADRAGLRNNVASVNAIVTTNGSYIFAGSSTNYLRAERWRWDNSAALVRAPGVFFGIGPDSDAEEEYTSFTIAGETSLRRQVATDFFVGPVYQAERVVLEETEAEGAIGRGVVVGSAEETFLSGVGFAMIRDTTGGVFWAEGGSIIEGEVRSFSGMTGSNESFGLYRMRGAVYVPLLEGTANRRGEKRAPHVLALQGRFRGAWGDVPFQHLPALGGDGVMRGLLDGRYRDRVAVIGQVEYRLPLSPRFAVVGFGSVGQVAPGIDDIELNSVKGAGGLGFRVALNKEQRLNLRIDLAFSPSGAAPYLSMGEAF
jgi:hypothetical protein